jgi:uncharacterized protein (TIGR03083 family)
MRPASISSSATRSSGVARRDLSRLAVVDDVDRRRHTMAMERVTKDELLKRIREDRRQFDAILARVPREQLTEPLLSGGWSVKDVLAHIAWGDREAIGVVKARALVGSELWNLSQDERNAAVVRESRSRDLDQVLGEYRASFEDYLAAVSELSDEELNEAERIADLVDVIPGWPPWRVFYDPGHYTDHGQTIEAALSRGEARATRP